MKSFQHLGTKMLSSSVEKCEDLETVNHSGSASTNSKADENNILSNNSEEQNGSPSFHGDHWKSEYMNSDFWTDENKKFLQMSQIKRSKSLGCILDKGRNISDEDEATDDEIKYSHKKNDPMDPFNSISSHVRHDSLFSIEVLEEFDIEHHDVVSSGCLSPDNHLPFTKSCSVTNLRSDTGKSTETMRILSRSLENLHSGEGGMPSSSNNISLLYDERKQKGSDSSGGLPESQETSGNYWFDSDNKITDETNLKLKNIDNYDELSLKELSTRRIEDWISQIDIGDVQILEEPGESSTSTIAIQEHAQAEIDVPKVKPDARYTVSMEMACNYISSLTATSVSAQMANLGLVAVPFLSGFSSLRVLNLSGNSIDRISSRSLPRGLHMLNLSKNKIAVIEGLRDMTRLRVLDLSYNRIVRIGHGLASCSSLKELYLAGNKISEVEGLHRLLKLNILDLRANRISTAKCLGQLAANYASLQTIFLEGNPAQRNVGDDQLKKYLLSLLPNLVHYDKHTTKATGTKEISDRPSRAVIARQYDRGPRTENKVARRGSHGSSLYKSALRHGSRSQNVESRHVRLLPGPVGTKLGENGRNGASMETTNRIKLSRSQGALDTL